MTRTALVIAALTLTACDVNLEKVLKLMSDRPTNLVVLEKSPVVLRGKPMVLSSTEPMKVVGEWASVCMVLKDGIPLQPVSSMDKIFSDALSGAKLTVELVLNDGARITLDQPMQAWARYGRILSRDELSACSSAKCGTRLPVGASVKAIEVAALPELQVRGIFWTSEQGPNERERAPSTTTTAQSASAQSKCRT